MIFFSATDIGGARAIIPVLPEVQKLSLPFFIIDGGVLSKESRASYKRISLSKIDKESDFKDFLSRNNIRLVCFGTAVKERLPIYHCAWAKELGIKTVCVLDNWMNYKKRLELPEFGLILPDHYFVMDVLAYEEALVDGIPGRILEITGHPGLASLGTEARNFNRKAFLDKYGFNSKREIIVFISEPASKDQGDHSGFPNYRGYTEFDVLQCTKTFLWDVKEKIEFTILPHPREDSEVLEAFCSKLFGVDFSWRILNIPKGREAVLVADGVIGMASILLYDAWLLQKPVISIQPNLKLPHLRYLEKRQGIHFMTNKIQIPKLFSSWWNEVHEAKWKISDYLVDLQIHMQAAKTISRRLSQLSH